MRGIDIGLHWLILYMRSFLFLRWPKQKRVEVYTIYCYTFLHRITMQVSREKKQSFIFV